MFVLVEIDKLILKFISECKRSKTVKEIINKKKEAGGLIRSGVRTIIKIEVCIRIGKKLNRIEKSPTSTELPHAQQG